MEGRKVQPTYFVILVFLLSKAVTSFAQGVPLETTDEIQQIDEQLARELRADMQAIEQTGQGQSEDPSQTFQKLQEKLKKKDAYNRLKNPAKSFNLEDKPDRRHTPWKPHAFRARLEKGTPLYHKDNDHKQTYQ